MDVHWFWTLLIQVIFNLGCGANGCSIPTLKTITMSNFDTIIQLKPVLIDFFPHGVDLQNAGPHLKK
jgi:hypothetical protein